MVKAIVLCGGKGTRLRPYTYTMPKPMLPLGKKPILEYVLMRLKQAGITEVCLATGYMHERIESHFGNGSRLFGGCAPSGGKPEAGGAKIGMKLSYSVEESEQGTAGSILPLKGRMDGTFVVMMGDHLSNLDIADVIAFHKKHRNIATIALNMKGVPLEYGVADLEGERVVRFREKPIIENYVNAGVYVFEPAIFDYIRPKEDFANDVFPRLLEKGQAIGGFVFSDYWLDIGRTTDYEHINQLISVIELSKGMG